MAVARRITALTQSVRPLLLNHNAVRQHLAVLKPGSTERYRSIAPTALNGLWWAEAALKDSDVPFGTTAGARWARAF